MKAYIGLRLVAFTFFSIVVKEVSSSLTLVGKVSKEYYWTVKDPVPKMLSGDEVSQFCGENGMRGAFITTAEDQSIIQSIVGTVGWQTNPQGGYALWLGGRFNDLEKKWVWPDGTTIEYNRWGISGSPRNSADIKCMYAGATSWIGGGWVDNWCDNRTGPLYPLCEKITTDFYGQGVVQLSPDSYELRWPGICNSQSQRRQSPINLVTPSNRDVGLRKSDMRFNMQYFRSHSQFFIINNGHTVQVQLEEEPTSDLRVSGIQGNTYRLAQIHFHWGMIDPVGSEHKVNGNQYPGEIHLVHYKDTYASIGGAVASGAEDALAVVGVLIQICPTEQTTKGTLAFRTISRALSSIINRNDCPNETMTKISSSIRISDLIPIDLAGQLVHQYNGSLTTPTCDETVIWKVYNFPLCVQREYFENFRKVQCNGVNVGDNFRTIQSPLSQAWTLTSPLDNAVEYSN